MIREFISGIWEGYKQLVVIVVTVYLALMVVVGGEVKGKIHWNNIADFWKTIKGK